jgi:hypothetical protein
MKEEKGETVSGRGGDSIRAAESPAPASLSAIAVQLVDRAGWWCCLCAGKQSILAPAAGAANRRYPDRCLSTRNSRTNGLSSASVHFSGPACSCVVA